MVARKRKNKTHHVEILIVACLIFVLGGIFLINNTNFAKGNLITGFVSSDVITEDFNLIISNSQEYELSTEDNFKVRSLSVSGNIKGEGVVRILFEDYEGNQKLVYSNIQETSRNGNLITGFAVADPEKIKINVVPSEPFDYVDYELSEDQFTVYGAFRNECSETCFINVKFAHDKSNKLIFQLSENTQVELNSISYTIESE
ncbi:MAG: hypothetical protein ABIG93_05085 [archaeon]|nr:hypothetical protein [Nanoarchaeota archaeon]